MGFCELLEGNYFSNNAERLFKSFLLAYFA